MDVAQTTADYVDVMPIDDMSMNAIVDATPMDVANVVDVTPMDETEQPITGKRQMEE